MSGSSLPKVVQLRLLRLQLTIGQRVPVLEGHPEERDAALPSDELEAVPHHARQRDTFAGRWRRTRPDARRRLRRPRSCQDLVVPPPAPRLSPSPAGRSATRSAVPRRSASVAGTASSAGIDAPVLEVVGVDPAGTGLPTSTRKAPASRVVDTRVTPVSPVPRALLRSVNQSSPRERKYTPPGTTTNESILRRRDVDLPRAEVQRAVLCPDHCSRRDPALPDRHRRRGGVLWRCRPDLVTVLVGGAPSRRPGRARTRW